MLKLYNTLTRKKEAFTPINENSVGIYGCGITPYKESHLGHAMQGIIFDIIRRYLEHKGYNVTYVRNYTDIDDKIIAFAKEKGLHPLEHSKNIMKQAEKDFAKLRIKPADYEPKVSDNIDEIINIIKVLIKKGLAYETSKGNVYYSIKDFKRYGQLSGQKIDELKVGTRKEAEEDKKYPLDFALWKSENVDMDLWDSPWGHGRPGWHIECSAMSSKYLGNHFDIHGGGKDLIFPHHENEIAQSVGAYDEFANIWIHNGLLMVGKEKMSKSLNNDTSISDWLRQYHSEVIRYLIISNHYRSNIQFNPKRYQDANRKVFEIYSILQVANELTTKSSVHMNNHLYNEILEEFEKYMDNDLNTPRVIAMLNYNSQQMKVYIEGEQISKLLATVNAIRKIGQVIGLFDRNPNQVLREITDLEIKKNSIDKQYVEEIINKRTKLRKEGKFAEADMIREKLKRQGIEIMDEAKSSSWRFTM